MDGVDELCVPTLVVGLTNKRSLVDPALLRPGRFEVQVEVPPPKTLEQRMSILQVHTRDMLAAGRLLVGDAPSDSAAGKLVVSDTQQQLPSYDVLLRKLAEACDGFSGASLAGVARAAASHALERAVEDFASHLGEDGEAASSSSSLLDSCVVVEADLTSAVEDVANRIGDNDWSEDDDKESNISSESNESVDKD